MSNIKFQADFHPLIESESFESDEALCLHLMHLKAYMVASELSKGRNVLDVGCNIGYGVNILSEVASSAVGIDVSPRAIEKARQKSSAANAEYYQYDGVKLPFEGRTFDVVTSFQVIEHLDSYEAYFSNITKSLNAEGKVIITTPNAAIRLMPGMKPWYEFHVREFYSAELKELLEKWFHNVEIKGLFATKEVYNIEFNRVTEIKNATYVERLPLLHPRKLRVKISALVPSGIKAGLRALVSPSEESSGSSQDKTSFGIEDFFYQPTELDSALDFMAICSNPK